jgi:hypothetical protein
LGSGFGEEVIMKSRVRLGQSTLEWVIGAAVILGTLVVGVMMWNTGLVSKMNDMVQKLTQTH